MTRYALVVIVFGAAIGCQSERGRPDATSKTEASERRQYQPDLQTPTGTASFSAAHVSVSGRLDPAFVPPGSTTELTITATPAAGWHVYAWQPTAPKTSISKPTLIVLDSDSPFVAQVARTDNEVIEKRDEVLGDVVRYHKGAVSWALPISVPADMEEGEYILRGIIGFQTCADDESVCDTPEGVRFGAKIRIVPPKSRSGSAEVYFTAATYQQAEAAAANER